MEAGVPGLSVLWVSGSSWSAANPTGITLQTPVPSAFCLLRITSLSPYPLVTPSPKALYPRAGAPRARGVFCSSSRGSARGSPRLSAGSTALAPPSGRASAETGEAPPHPVRHRPFKEGDILHINKRGPRERGGSLPGVGGTGWGGVPGPRIPRPAAGREGGREGGFWGGGPGQRGSLETARERLASANRTAAGPSAPGPPPAVRDPGGFASASGGTGGRETGHPGRRGHGRPPTAPLPPGECESWRRAPTRCQPRPLPRPGQRGRPRGTGGPGGFPPHAGAAQQQRGRGRVPNTPFISRPLPPEFRSPAWGWGRSRAAGDG